jgi:O-antigen/teichoic acid export membrane protein
MKGIAKNKESRMLFRNTILYSLSGALYALTPLALMPLLTKSLNIDEYAYYVLISSAIGFTIPFIGFGAVNSVIIRYFSLGKSEFNIYLSSVFGVMFFSFICFMLAVLFLPNSIISFFEPGVEFLLFSICMAFLAAISLMFVSLHVASANAMGYLRAYASYGIILFASTVLFCGFYDYGLIGACLGLACGYVAFVIASCLGSKVAKLELKWKYANARDAVQFGSPLMIHSGAVVFISLSDRFAVSNWLGTDAVASYGVTVQLALMVGFFFHSMNKVVQPIIYSLLKSGGDSNQRIAISYAYLYCIAVFIFSSLYLLVFPFLVLWFAGIKYRLPIDVYFFIILGGAFNSMYLVISHFIYFKEKTLILSLITFSCAIAYFAFLLVFTPRYGLSGVAFSFALVNGFMLFLSILLARLCTSVNWFDKSLLSSLLYKAWGLNRII